MAGKKATKQADSFDDAQGVDTEDGEEGGSVTIDLSGVEDDAGYAVVPRALYPVELVECEFSFSQRSGKPMWTWVLEVEEGHENAGTRFWFYVSFSEKALSRSKKTIAAVAPDLLDGPFDPEVVADDGRLLGLRMRARVNIRRYEGSNRNNVREVLAPEGEGFAD